MCGGHHDDLTLATLARLRLSAPEFGLTQTSGYRKCDDYVSPSDYKGWYRTA